MMSEYEGHTPGPWYWKPLYIPYEDDDEPAVWRVTNKTTWNELDDFDFDIQVDTNESDARLIADAPKLLAQNERLQEALSELRRRARIATCSYFADDPEEHVIVCMEELDDELQDAGGE